MRDYNSNVFTNTGFRNWALTRFSGGGLGRYLKMARLLLALVFVWRGHLAELLCIAARR